MDEKDINRLSLRWCHEAEEFPVPFSFKKGILWFFSCAGQFGIHTALISKEANTANEGFSKWHKGSI